ncbi:MAG TPA: bifunctional homocysteine S-methyltransferase/methylenetetrahydrofolate reductase [Chloroflexota bacterium]|nr:bifunctional homocysteine S-methyltransferase/methylenetetrahydrofolate reductase [Chloroflexota bacterium]
MEHPFLERLLKGPLLADGAMGTELFRRGVHADQCLDAVNLSRPDLIQQIHQDYIAAGSELIETNTFGANPFRLAQFGLADRQREINRRGAELAREAREAMGEPVFIAGAIGPSGALFEPFGRVSYVDVAEGVKGQIDALTERGVDLLLFETFTDLNELVAVVDAARRLSGLPIVAQMSFGDSQRTASGHDVGQVAEALDQLQVSVIGINCGEGPRQTLDLVRSILPRSGRFLSAMPNAGYPARIGGRIAYLATPEYFAAFARNAVESGATIVGGCCGTTPDHIRAMCATLPREARRPASAAVPRTQPRPAPTEPTSEPETNLAAKLRRGDFVISVEIDPPKGSSPSKALRGAAQLQEAGVDLINIGDSPMAKVRMSAVGLALLIQEKLGLETLIHMTSRDRNLMALQSDLLGLHALGIRHVLALTGDPPRSSSQPQVTAVWDVDSVGLVGILNRFNQGSDLNGTSIGRPTRFLIGCAVSPNVEAIDDEIDRLRQKLDAGADFIMSQPLFSVEQFERFRQKAGLLPVPLILGILPLESFRQADFLHHEVPGFDIPQDVRDTLYRAGERSSEEGLRLADELVQSVRSEVAGIYIITSYGRYDAAIALTRKLARESIPGEAS